MHQIKEFLEILDAIDTFVSIDDMQSVMDTIEAAKDTYNHAIELFEESERPKV
jgi:hypothetical protein